MAPVTLNLIGLHRRRRDVLFLGWLGPRGLASLVFTLLALEQLTGTAATFVSAVMATTVLLSVLAHGLSAGPIAGRWPERPTRVPHRGQRLDRPRRASPECGVPAAIHYSHADSTNSIGLTAYFPAGPVHGLW